MTALRGRDRTGRGQVVDMAIIEPILTVLGPQPLWYDQLGYVQPRTGNRSENNAPRNTYRTADGSWVAVSTSAQSVAERVHAPGRPARADRRALVRHRRGTGRHADVLDEAVGAGSPTTPATRSSPRSRRREAAVAPVYDIRDVMADPQYAALDTITEIAGPRARARCGCRTSSSGSPRPPAAIRWAGRPHGADTDAVLAELGLTGAEITALRSEGAL